MRPHRQGDGVRRMTRLLDLLATLGGSMSSSSSATLCGAHISALLATAVTSRNFPVLPASFIKAFLPA
jgi:hypothetical protein